MISPSAPRNPAKPAFTVILIAHQRGGLALFRLLGKLSAGNPKIPGWVDAELGAILRTLSCTLLVGLPVFFAAVCFSRLFREQKVTGYALGINLVGAMGGGLVEYLSMLLGMRAVWLVILGVYLAAWGSAVAIRRSQ